MEVSHAIARKGSKFAGHGISELVGGSRDLTILDDIERAGDCDIFIDCINAEPFMNDNCRKYERMGKALVIATTAFSARTAGQPNGLYDMDDFCEGTYELHDSVPAENVFIRA